jgi:hypothetical protein
VPILNDVVPHLEREGRPQKRGELVREVLGRVGVCVAHEGFEEPYRCGGADVDGGEELDEPPSEVGHVVGWGPDAQLALEEGEGARALGPGLQVVRGEGSAVACPLVCGDVARPLVAGVDLAPAVDGR